MPRAALSFALAASMAGLWPVAGSMAGLWPAGSALAAGPQPEAPTSLTAPTLQPMPDAISTDPATAKPATGVKPVKPGRAKPVEPAKAAKTAPAGPIAPKRAERSVPQPDFALRSSVPDDPVITGTTTPRKAYTPASPGDATVPVDPSLDVTAPAPDQGDDDQLVPNITVPDPAMQPPGVAPTTAWTPARSSSSTQPAGNPQTTTDPNAAPPQVTPQAPRKARPKPNSPGPAQPVQVPVAADQAKLAATVAIPATTPSPRSMEADPLAESPTLYDPPGLRTGNFIWRPAIEVSAGGTTNVQSSHDGISSSALRLAPELVGQSDWSRHAFGIDLRGAFTEFPADRSLYRPTVNANATGRVDITDEMRLNLKAGYAVDKLPAASTQLAAGTSTAGYQQTITASVGLTQEFGRFAVTLRGDVDRTVNEVSSIGGTATTAATPLDSTHYVAALRGTFAWTEAVKPFLEGDLTLRRYDDAVVATGVAPPTDLSSRGYIGKTGVVLDFGPMLSGEASVGYGREKPYDASLSAVDGMTFDGSLIWSPTRLTRVTFNATTAFESTLLTGASGAIAHTAGVKVADDLRRNLTAELGGSVLLRDYTGVSRRETIASANAALIWKWNPHLQTFLRASYDNYASTAGDDDYRTTTVFAGLRLQ